MVRPIFNVYIYVQLTKHSVKVLFTSFVYSVSKARQKIDYGLIMNLPIVVAFTSITIVHHSPVSQRTLFADECGHDTYRNIDSTPLNSRSVSW